MLRTQLVPRVLALGERAAVFIGLDGERYLHLGARAARRAPTGN